MNVSVKELVADALRTAGLPSPVRIVNDADAEALAESRVGVIKGAHTALVVKIAGGLGSAVLHEGRVLSGARGFAGEIGHVPIDSIMQDGDTADPLALDGARRCSCGSKGHLQTIVSIAAAVDRLAPGLASRRGSYLAAIEEIERTVAEETIDAVMHELGVVLGRSLCTPVAMLNPDMIVLRPASFPSSRLVSGVLDVLRAALLDVPAVRLGSQAGLGQWMGAQGAALVVSDEYARPRVHNAQADWRSVPKLAAISPLPAQQPTKALSRV
jgi:glucokinase